MSEAPGACQRPTDARFRRMVETLEGYAVFLLDIDGCIVSWNVGAEVMNGYTSEEIYGEHFSIFYTAEAKLVVIRRLSSASLVRWAATTSRAGEFARTPACSGRA